jgi:hypothetical protein
MITRNSMKLNFSALLLLLGLGVASCSEPSAPVGAGSDSYGTLSGRDMRDYYYPRQAGWTYIYKNTFAVYDGTSNTVGSTVVGSIDTLRTRGFSNVTPGGDSLYAMDISYRVLSNFANKNRFNLYYFKKGQSNNGGFIVGNNPTGFDRSDLDSISTVSSSIDTILYATEGPTRDLIDNPASTSTRYVRNDRIFYSAKGDSVYIWFKEGSTMRKVRQLWYSDFEKNADWQYATWDNYTYFKVGNEDVSVSTEAGNFSAAELDVITEDLNTPVKEVKYWGNNTGLVKQYDEWRTTTDGVNYTRKSKVRELISRSYHP